MPGNNFRTGRAEISGRKGLEIIYHIWFADLAFEEDDGWVVIDYNTDRLDGRKEELIRTYTPQVEAYRSALAADGVAVKEAGLWFSDTGETWMSRA